MSQAEAFLKGEANPQIVTIQNYKIKEIGPKHGLFKRIYFNVTVEPVVLLYILSSTMYQLTSQNLYLEKTCRVHLGYNVSVCDAMSERNESGYSSIEEAEVQKHVSKLFAFASFVQGFFPVCLMLFVGSWSDRHNRRKPLILVPILGEIVAVSLLILNTIYFEEIPVVFAAISTTLPPALTGGWPCLLLGVYSYISAVSDDNNKTAKVGACSSVQNLALIIGLGSAGLLLGPLGFLKVYSICFVMLLVALIYGYWRIEDTEIIHTSSTTKKEKGLLLDFFNIKYCIKTLVVFFRKGPNNRKWKLIVIIFVTILVQGAIQGEYAVTYLYTRYKFKWNEMDYSLFFTVHSVMDLIGSFIALVILSKYFGWKDASLGILALISTGSADLMYAFAPNYKVFYAGVLLDIFYTITYIALRSLMAKIVSPDELGQSNSVFGLCEALMPSVFGPLYTKVYAHSIEYFPGMYYFISLVMYTLAICFFIWLYKQTREDEVDGKQMKEIKARPSDDDEDE
ncbi:hypothetical protein HHI36_020568 [Cryptolaemus montrouzieri]|uniref:Proton-coupled folate transporter n=1 Tax=Cryptolaemus montrouzieri TaxID=559131 RepID=A0ABD2NBU1_9CUCU